MFIGGKGTFYIWFGQGKGEILASDTTTWGSGAQVFAISLGVIRINIYLCAKYQEEMQPQL